MTVVLLAVDIIDLLQVLLGQGIGQVGILALQHLGCLDRISSNLDILGIGINLSLDDVLQLDAVKQRRGLGILCQFLLVSINMYICISTGIITRKFYPVLSSGTAVSCRIDVGIQHGKELGHRSGLSCTVLFRHNYVLLRHLNL